MDEQLIALGVEEEKARRGEGSNAQLPRLMLALEDEALTVQFAMPRRCCCERCRLPEQS